ncbi:MAG: sugar ABC transporter permease [Candidatus Aerophobus sp.]|nr:MAG: sugar ABC transporter permease [Candidatus Aerophobus sp.]
MRDKTQQVITIFGRLIRLVDRHLPILLILPAIVVVGLLIFYPMAYNFVISFTNKSMFPRAIRFVGLANYAKLSTDQKYLNALGNDLIYTFSSVPLTLVVGMAIALVLNREKLVLRRLFRTLVIFPWVIPIVVVVMIWRWLLNPIYGLVSYLPVFMRVTNSPVLFFNTPFKSMASTILIMTWRGLPLITVIYLAALQTVPGEFYEVTQINGASWWQTLIYVTLPSLKQTIAVTAILRIIWTFNFFSLVWLLTGGGPVGATEILPITAYLRGFFSYKMGEAATVTITMFLILLLFVFIYFRVSRQEA